jgi:TM2 domain-containing membrane protein YozV
MSQGSSGNVIAALVSFFIPGLGQLIQGRILAAFVQFIGTGLLRLIWLGWLGHIFSCVDAARWKAR